MNLDALANYYGLPRDEIQEMLENTGSKHRMIPISNTLPLHFVETDGKITVIGINKEKIYNHPKNFFILT